tara:strand:- start:1015 stop:1512 length:498 start_codon:yes stop_codon:yes gene_type:complete
MITVELTDREIRIARAVGRLRTIDSRAAHLNDQKYGSVADQTKADVNGCLGEMAAAKALNRYWRGMGTDYKHDTDIGHEEVRMTGYPQGRLIIRPTDAEKPCIDKPWILVVQDSLSCYRLPGWIIGRDGLQPQYLAAPSGRPEAYFVPQSALRSFPILINQRCYA